MNQQIRTVKKIVRGRRAVDGAGVHLVRLFGRDEVQDFDPFLLMDAFDSTNPDDYIKGFPWHPHRGIETVTYLIKGDLEHGDSLGNSGSIFDGDCQWMTAGSGIIHQEMPQAADHLLGCQIWLNLPARDKMVPPQYNDILDADVPVIGEEGVKIHIIAGQYKDFVGAFEGKYVQPLYLDVEAQPGVEWHLETDPDNTLFVYIISGEAAFDPNNPTTISSKNVVLLSKGEQFWMRAGSSGVRFLLLSGRPLNEPIAWGGPIVMNTRQELTQAFRDLEEENFIK